MRKYLEYANFVAKINDLNVVHHSFEDMSVLYPYVTCGAVVSRDLAHIEKVLDHKAGGEIKVLHLFWLDR